MSGVLDITPLRSLIAIADAGGFRRAAARLTLTQSAVSNHMRRLEATVGEPLVERHGRDTRFTPAGDTLLTQAREIIRAHDQALALFAPAAVNSQLVIGTTEHAADEILQPIMAALEQFYPGVQTQFRFDRGLRLRDAVDRNELDIAVFVTSSVFGTDEAIGTLPLRWCAAPGWAPPAGSSAYPVVTIHAPCSIRTAGMQALAAHNITMNVMAEAAYLAGVINAARAGIGVALLAFNGEPPRGLVERRDLPPVPPIQLFARVNPRIDPGIANVLLEALRATFAPGSPTPRSTPIAETKPAQGRRADTLVSR
jgi:DNA-binding transcriptional LysR family regulator